MNRRMNEWEHELMNEAALINEWKIRQDIVNFNEHEIVEFII